MQTRRTFLKAAVGAAAAPLPPAPALQSEAEWLEARILSVNQIVRLFNVPAHLITGAPLGISPIESARRVISHALATGTYGVEFK